MSKVDTFSNSYLLVINTFSNQLLLYNKYCFSTATALEELFFIRSNYSEHVLFPGRHFFRTASFSEEVEF